MLLRLTAVAATLCSAVSAFRDASPFLLLSTAKLTTEAIPGPHIASGKDLDGYLQDALRSCSTQAHVIVRQPGVSAADLSSRQASPHLLRRLEDYDTNLRTKTVVSNVRDFEVDATFAASLAARCNATVATVRDTDSYMADALSSPQVIEVLLSSLPTEPIQRLAALGRHDGLVNDVINRLPKQDYTLVYLTTPPSPLAYESAHGEDQMYAIEEEFPAGMHTDMKRDLSSSADDGNKGGNINSDLPLFEKYQFVNSAIFMSVTVSLLLVAILMVGLNAISGLEVSYMAFSKEMNPNAHKKQQ